MKQFFPWCWLWLVLLPGYGIAATNITGLHLQDAAGYSTLVIDLDGPAEINLFTLDNPNRVVVDLPGARLSNPRQLHALKGALLRGARAAAQSDGRLRIVLDVTRPLWPRSYFTGDDKAKSLVVELRDSSGGAKTTDPIVSALALPPSKVMPVSPKARSIPIVSRKLSPNAGVSDIALASLAQTHPQVTPTPRSQARLTMPWSEHSPSVVKIRDIVVAVDAGHGGKDPGATGPGGTEEKDVTLAIARRVAELLRRERGMRSVLTRSNDSFVPLRERIQQAHASKADLFISIHADAANDSSVTGASVYILSERGASSEAARMLAEQENSVDFVGGIHLEGHDNNLARTLLDMSQSATRDASLAVASRLLTSMEQVGTLSRSAVERAGFLVLKSPDIPSVLVETAYLSNPEEEEKLADPHYQQSIAQAILKGVRAYFLRSPPSGTLLAQIQTTQLGSMELVRR